jgi:hypothetical protein
MTPRVFALQFREHQEYTAAEAYGEIIFLTRLEWNAKQAGATKRIEREIVHTLTVQRYAPGVDLLLPTGSQPAQVLLGRLLERHYPKAAHSLLYWAPRRMEYTVTHV